MHVQNLKLFQNSAILHHYGNDVIIPANLFSGHVVDYFENNNNNEQFNSRVLEKLKNSNSNSRVLEQFLNFN